MLHNKVQRYANCSCIFITHYKEALKKIKPIILPCVPTVHTVSMYFIQGACV